ncbi:MAG: hypothetical protein JWO10_359, partial [Microbacteriaceae bacterium]|nr:hypothetical protein [Microbacteriaceae bacterium]
MFSTRLPLRALATSLATALVAGGLVVGGFAIPAQAVTPAAQVTLATTAADGSASTSGTPLIGENTTFTVSFDNIATSTVGYGPRVDLYFDKTGVDGGTGGLDDGMTFGSATYLGQPVSAVTYVIPPLEAGQAEDGMFVHPVLKVKVPIPAGYQRGDELVVLSLPFGSFTPGQPTVDVKVTAAISDLADLNANLSVLAQPWFRYGYTPLDDPTTDNPLDTYGASATIGFKPQLYRLTQTYLGPEGETATGPSYVRAYRVSLDVADGQTITDLNLKQLITSDINFDGTVTAISPGGGTPTTGADGATVHWDSVTGSTSTKDASFEYSYFVNQFSDAAQTVPVLDPATGAKVTTTATATATNKWLANDPRDNTPETIPCTPVGTPPTCTPTVVYHPVDVQVGPYTSTFNERSLAVQKTHSGDDDVLPGQSVTWTTDAQVSDYFAFGAINFTDTASDGLLVDENSFQLSWPGHDPIDFASDQKTVAINAAGETTMKLDVSAALLAAGVDGGFAVGDHVTTNENGPSTFSITYKTTVMNSYRAQPDEGHRVVSPGDPFGNSANVTATIATPQAITKSVTDPTDGTVTQVPDGFLLQAGTTEVTDGSSKGLHVSNGTLVQTVYARNGDTTATTDSFAPGDLITYRIRQTLPVQSYEQLLLKEYLPLPVHTVSTIHGPVTSLASGDVIPAENEIAWGPSNSLDTAMAPAVSTDATSNSVSFA